MTMKNNISQNPSNAGDDDNLWPDWNPIHGVGKDSRGDADMSFEDIRKNSLKGAKERAEDAGKAREAHQKATFEYDADSYQPAKSK